MNDKDKVEKNTSVGNISMDATLATGDVGVLDSLVSGDLVAGVSYTVTGKNAVQLHIAIGTPWAESANE